jgi:SH3-like domain-containing protein
LEKRKLALPAKSVLKSLSAGVALLIAAAVALPAHAQTSKGPSGLPLPRFVSLKSKKVNLRIGPGTTYAASWMYLKSGLPVEVIQEYDNWRKIRDADGTEGWVNQALLSGTRTAIAAPWMKSKGPDIYVNMRREPQANATIIAKLEPGVVVHLTECNGDWCEADYDGTDGWISQGEIWGAYPGEVFK